MSKSDMSTAQASPHRARYENPLVSRYASAEMSYLWSPHKKFSTWRFLWLTLAEGEQSLGLDITDTQLAEMREHLDDIDFDLAKKKERELRHDVMAHIHTFGTACPTAMPVIHLGATSCFVGDNTDLIQLKQGLELVKRKLVQVMAELATFARAQKDVPTLGFTHYQPAQLVTVGKRATLWLEEFLLDYYAIEWQLELLDRSFRGVKGTTGTQASFLELFEGDHDKVNRLNARVTELMGFSGVIPVSGQTYTRKLDHFIVNALAGIAQSANKMAVDLRLLQNLKEVEEPFEKSQVGSSAMAYKRNPMRSERICALSRHVMTLPASTINTAANQWFERSLDDSANRRVVLPEAFLGVDVILGICHNVVDGLHVWPHVIRARLDAELPFMATENILMACVKAGGDRQELHEAIREHSMAAGLQVKAHGKPNDLMQRIAADPRFKPVHGELEQLTDPSKFIGRCPEQVDEFLDQHIEPVLRKEAELLKKKNQDEITV